MFQLMVGASSVVAFLVNLSIYWIIGNTSPLTYPSERERERERGGGQAVEASYPADLLGL